MNQLRGVDPLMYIRAVGLLVRNPVIMVVPLLMAIIGVFVAQLDGGAGGGGGFSIAGITGFLVLLLQLFGFGTATIMADQAWRRNRTSFDDGWTEARQKGRDILFAALGFTFVLSIAGFAGRLVGFLALFIYAAAVFFLIYTIPAAAIGGVPGGAALQVSIERARANPIPTVVVTVVAVGVYFLFNLILAPFLIGTIAPLAFQSANLIASLIGAVFQSIVIGYIALIVGKTYSDVSFGNRY